METNIDFQLSIFLIEHMLKSFISEMMEVYPYFFRISIFKIQTWNATPRTLCFLEGFVLPSFDALVSMSELIFFTESSTGLPC